MAGLRVGRSVGVLLPWGVIAGVVPWPLGTQRPLATPALLNCQNFHFFVFISLHVKSRIVC